MYSLSTTLPKSLSTQQTYEVNPYNLSGYIEMFRASCSLVLSYLFICCVFRIHKEEKNDLHKCDHCGKLFMTRSGLSKHKRCVKY